MLLVIDAGNTNLVFALYGGGQEPLGSWRIRTDSARSRDEYASWLLPLFSQFGKQLTDVSDVIVSSVVPDANHHLRGFARQYIEVEPRFVDYDMVRRVGLEVNVDFPREVGADRLVNSVAVISEYRYPAIVIDFGTATTFDAIDASGSYVGGAICPGINLSLKALHQGAAMLPRISIQRTERAIGRRTIEAMQSGVFWGYAGLIEGMVSRMSSELGGNPFVIATGGLAPVFEGEVASIGAIDRNLTIKGLYHIYQRCK
ncbi:MAG: type III pantothenate kinase [Alphaproteobacteria bacterium]|nr:type III pantothenate kinase [Alphaproteobacteria bacterium]